MKKKILALSLATITAFSIPQGVLAAQTIPVTGDSATGSSDTSFSATADMLGGGLVVTIPDTVTLDYNAEDGVFEKETSVNAKGYIEVDKYLSVSVPTDVTYSLKDHASVTADGKVTFGTTVDDNQVTDWTQVELKTKDAGNVVIGVDKALNIQVEEEEVTDIGVYEAVLNFDIQLLSE